jgi:hypothetical protein
MVGMNDVKQKILGERSHCWKLPNGFRIREPCVKFYFSKVKPARFVQRNTALQAIKDSI